MRSWPWRWAALLSFCWSCNLPGSTSEPWRLAACRWRESTIVSWASRRKLMAAFSFAGMSGSGRAGHARDLDARNCRPYLSHDRSHALSICIPSRGFVRCFGIHGFDAAGYTEALHPKTFDLYLYSFDCSLRRAIQFSGWASIFARHLWFRFAGLLFYIALPLPLALGLCRPSAAEKQSCVPVMLAFLVTGPLGVLFLQHGSGNRAGPHFWTEFSLAPFTHCRKRGTCSWRRSGEGAAQCDSVFTHGLGAAGMVEFQGTGPLDSRHRAGFCNLHGSGDARVQASIISWIWWSHFPLP